jgi:hypothetical protein
MKKRTVMQIGRKSQVLRERLSKKKVYENFGDKEKRKLDDFIGDFFSYTPDERKYILKITIAFIDFCETYTGK